MMIKVVLEAYEDGGFAAYAPSLPGCISEGETEKETLDNIKEAIELCLEGQEAALDVERKLVKNTEV